MRCIGFSTGAVARGDFRKGLELQRELGATAVELSALRAEELPPLVEALPSLDLNGFDYVSLHAPSRLNGMTEDNLITLLASVLDRVDAIVLHPDVIRTPSKWALFEHKIVLENMDQRKPLGRTLSELRPLFEKLPKARFCLDVAHARQVDPTMGVAVELLRAFRDRLAHLHISEVNSAGSHIPISQVAENAYARIASLFPDDSPAIIESMVDEDSMARELRTARACTS